MASWNHFTVKHLRTFIYKYTWMVICKQGEKSSKKCYSCGSKIEPGEKFLQLSAGSRDEINLCPDCCFIVGGEMRKAFTKKERALSAAKKVMEEL